jgi:tetratricopeptide (TPR) repeat protein
VTTLPSAPAAARDTAALSAREAAKARFERARSRQDAGDYREAIVEYQAAYAIEPLPELLFNIGQCYRLLDDPQDAILYYERYLQIVGNEGASAEARAHVQALRARLAAPPAPPPLTPAPAPAREASRSRVWPWLGAGALVAGLTVVGVGVWYGFEAENAEDRIESSSGEFTPELENLERDGKDAERNMLVLTSVGASLAVVGGLTWWLGSRGSEERSRLNASVGTHGFAITWSGHF